ncbi:hypothetical protein [Arthrobacter sp. 754]|uniref:hypothetical protein n=1 Tax=Arthrobacter sp. 754 TaxID=3156315 RepID=UPI0033995EF0
MEKITTPATVRELGNQAEAQGKTATERLIEFTTPPAGFTKDSSSTEDWATFSGPTFEGDGWKVTSHWTLEDGVTFYVDGDGDNALKGAEAGKIAEALAQIAALI